MAGGLPVWSQGPGRDGSNRARDRRSARLSALAAGRLLMHERELRGRQRHAGDRPFRSNRDWPAPQLSLREAGLLAWYHTRSGAACGLVWTVRSGAGTVHHWPGRSMTWALSPLSRTRARRSRKAAIPAAPVSPPGATKPGYGVSRHPPTPRERSLAVLRSARTSLPVTATPPRRSCRACRLFARLTSASLLMLAAFGDRVAGRTAPTFR